MRLGISMVSGIIDTLNQYFNYDFIEIADFVFPQELEDADTKLQKVFNKQKDANLLCIQGPVRDIKPEAGDKDIRDITVKRFKQLIDLASKYKAKYVLFFTTFDNNVKLESYKKMWLENNKKFWKEIIPYAEEKKVICLYCNVWDDEPYLLKELFRYIDSEYFQFGYDIGHAHFISKCPYSKWIEELKDYIKYVAIHDNEGEMDSHRALGRGNIKIKEIINKLIEENLDLDYCIQLFDNTELQNSIDIFNEIVSSK